MFTQRLAISGVFSSAQSTKQPPLVHTQQEHRASDVDSGGFVVGSIYSAHIGLVLKRRLRAVLREVVALQFRIETAQYLGAEQCWRP